MADKDKDSSDYKKIVELLRSGKPLPVVAKELKISEEDVVRLLNEKAEPLKDADKEKLVRLQAPPPPPPKKRGLKTKKQASKDMFRHRRRSKKLSWTRADFPHNPQDKEKIYYCADCKSSNKSYHCEFCGRKCWKYCNKCEEPGYYSNHHHCFKKRRSARTMKRKRTAWKREQFPTQKFGDFYCMDCRKENKTRDCECGRSSWKWCDQCSAYLSKHHFPCMKLKLDSPNKPPKKASKPKKQTNRQTKKRKMREIPPPPQILPPPQRPERTTEEMMALAPPKKRRKLE